MVVPSTAAAISYEEPTIQTILILASFLLLLSITGHVIDHTISSGLLAQLLLGTGWGSPGAQWLPISTEETFTSLGYLGLILLVYEGGLSTDIAALRSNLVLSVFVALTGIATPIGLSFLLIPLLRDRVLVSPLQAFTAGAALCSTSLGTTFTLLKSSGLTSSRLGVVLSCAAMLDDVVGLVMVQIISNLGDAQFKPATLLRPVGVSIAFTLFVPATCWWVIRPLRRRLKIANLEKRLIRLGVNLPQFAFLVHTTLLLAFVASSSYAGTSNLFAAYLAGALISWYDNDSGLESSPVKQSVPKKPLQPSEAANDEAMKLGENPSVDDLQRNKEKRRSKGEDMQITRAQPTIQAVGKNLASANPSHDDHVRETKDPPSNKYHDPQNGLSTYAAYYSTPISTLLQPLFFASLGFSLPISRMFIGPIIWRGLVYAVLMALGKFACGLWLVRFSSSSSSKPSTSSKTNTVVNKNNDKGVSKSETALAKSEEKSNKKTCPVRRRPKSVYPSLLLGSAMVARGEVGFLISAVAEGRGIFSPSTSSSPSTPSASTDASSELFLIVTWAIMLCTFAGPITVGFLTKRVRRLQAMQSKSNQGAEDPLGVWGVG